MKILTASKEALHGALQAASAAPPDDPSQRMKVCQGTVITPSNQCILQVTAPHRVKEAHRRACDLNISCS